MAMMSDLHISFRDNPFRILHLPANADTTEIQAKYAVARVAAQLDGDDGNEQLDRLLKAHSELLNNRSRWAHEATWFYDPPDCLFDSTIENQDQLLSSYQEQAMLPGEDGIRGKHDLCNWLLLLAMHSDAEKKELSIRALSSWSELIDNPEYRRMLAPSHGGQAPTGNQLWGLAVLSQLALAAREDANKGHVTHVVAYIEALQTAGMTRADVTDVAGEALRQFCNRLHKAREDVQARVEQGSVGITRGPVVDWAEIIMNQAIPLKMLLSVIDESGVETGPVFAECTNVLDAAARDIREFVVKWSNNSGSAATAVTILTRARCIAATAYGRESLSLDIAELTYSEAISRMISHSRSRSWDQALEAARSALEAAPDEERRESAAGYVRKISEAAATQSPSGGSGDYSGLWKLGGVIIMVGLIALCNFAVSRTGQESAPSNNPSRNSTPNESASPQRSTGNNTTTQSRQMLRSQIETNNVKLDQLQNDYERLLDQYNAICPIDGCTLPPDLYRRAAELESRLNALDSRYDRLLRDTNVLIDQYNNTR